MSDNTTELNGADSVVAQSPRNGFETQFKLDHYLSYVRIAALDSEGNIIGATKAVDTLSRKVIDLDYDVTEVTRGGAKSVSGVPSSTAVSMPTFTGAAESSSETTQTTKSPIANTLLGGFVVCAIAVL